MKKIKINTKKEDKLNTFEEFVTAYFSKGNTKEYSSGKRKCSQRDDQIENGIRSNSYLGKFSCILTISKNNDSL